TATILRDLPLGPPKRKWLSHTPRSREWRRADRVLLPAPSSVRSCFRRTASSGGEMELPFRPKGDELLRPGAMLAVRDRLRRHAKGNDLASVAAYAFDHRTR